MCLVLSGKPSGKFTRKTPEARVVDGLNVNLMSDMDPALLLDNSIGFTLQSDLGQLIWPGSISSLVPNSRLVTSGMRKISIFIVFWKWRVG